MRTFKLKVNFIFTGTVKVKANSHAEAVEIADNNFWMVAGEIGDSGHGQIKDWNINTTRAMFNADFSRTPVILALIARQPEPIMSAAGQFMLI